MEQLEKEAVIGPLYSEAFDKKQLNAYASASADKNPIHLDEKAAQAAGFDKEIAHGMLVMAAAHAALNRELNRVSIVDSYETRFYNPLYAGGQLTFWFVVKASEENNALVSFQYVGKDQQDRRIVTGKIVLRFL
ncbi:MaoC family dehydratase [Salsuginibacillus kocurii]|uniref:MaoC family dehydratase n=1 Tax=Salsuginibacillus kocurii TaxID=427078 RepID=UPI000377D272|nr:MaoC family dehydratase [Salsuginibacillus kocurii]